MTENSDDQRSVEHPYGTSTDNDSSSSAPRVDPPPDPDQSKDEETPETPDQHRIRIVRELLRKHKGDSRYIKGILEGLKNTEIKPPRAAAWSDANLRSFLTTHFPEEMAKIVTPRTPKKVPTRPPKAKTKTPRDKKVKQDEPKVAPPPKTPPLREIIPLPQQEPAFREDLPNSKQGSFRVPKELLDLVNEKLKRDKKRTGGNVARLVRVLLWLYVGAPDQFVEPEYKPE